ncbi:septum-promoting GTP-binding protein 1 [Xylona heveae TC161]|uniref:Septum-promoting GTP-binding protein 1 n=1 Tax=Xylona heveae (strain CBS 132557 / TC161) TaxID=1328760 RepID=A0A165K2W4_XYLHT|nr:septum-promoting GTP-binding protein 1 [Xylona heveae TC161]KZF26925.1 septum-promoting GTP-binding protein 1 [Xylona heveae TC161]
MDSVETRIQQEAVSSPPEEHYTNARPVSRQDPELGIPENVSASPTSAYHDGYGNPQAHLSPPIQSPEYSPSRPSMSPASEADASARYPSPNMLYQQPSIPTVSGSSGYASSQGETRTPTYQEQTGQGRPSQHQSQASKNSVVIKVGMVGDAQIGKTSLMVKYVEGSWDEDYIQTLGVNFMEKTISIRNTEITFSIWDLGGQREFVNMLPLVCNDAVAILFMFDLTRKSTLNSIKEWYRQGRGFNKTAIPFLIGTKYDHFVNFPRDDQEEISNQARRFAKAMKASLIFSSTSHSINVQKIFKIVLAKAFDLKCTIPEIENVGEPLLLYTRDS